MIYQHKYFTINTKTRKVFDENGKELRLTGNPYRLLVFLSQNHSANLTQIGEYLDHAKEFTEDHIRQYRHKIETAISRDIIEYKNGIYSILGPVKEVKSASIPKRNTGLLRQQELGSDEKMEKSTFPFYKFPALVAIIALLGALLPIWPYGYFNVLRIVVTAVALYYIYYLYQHQRTATFWFWLMIGIAILFNPIAPVYLYDRELWSLIDIALAGILVTFAFNFRNKVYERAYKK